MHVQQSFAYFLQKIDGRLTKRRLAYAATLRQAQGDTFRTAVRL
jgi:hypothetical protein